MILYHGSLEIVEKPEVRPSNRTLDYGIGFYTTSSARQAEDWVKRRLKECDAMVGYVNSYTFDKRALSVLSCLIFDSPSEQWVDFVMRNRTQVGYNHTYDIVYGPVANDRVYASFALFEGGFLSKQNLIAELKTYRLVDQYLFHSQTAINYLTFIEAKRVQQ